MARRNRYTKKNFLIDVILLCLTGPVGGVWIFCREMRNR